MIAENITALIGQTPVLRLNSLSELSGCELLVKCEFTNPGGSIKDRAALSMVQGALRRGELRPGMTIIEGTAGNTGIGLALVARLFGCGMKVVMPRGQAAEKERLITLHGADLELTDVVPFADPRHFYHTAGRIAAENPDRYWWANQFENLDNSLAHFTRTGPEILAQTQGRLDAFVSAAGTGGTISGCSRFLKEALPDLQVVLADPEGSGLYQYLKTGQFSTSGSSLTEGIGIMRLVANFARAHVDQALKITDQELVTVSRHVAAHDGLVLGSSSALNVAAALRTALQLGPGHRVLTFACDGGERSASKLYQAEFLAARGLRTDTSIHELVEQYRHAGC
jgi:cysteine synthase A